MKKSLIIVGLLIVAIAIVLMGKGRSKPCHELQPVVSGKRALPKLLDLGAGKCASCKAMTPILEELAGTFSGQLNVEYIDVWEHEEVAEHYGVRIIPVQIFFDAEGNELFRHEGFYAREDILAKWTEFGYALEGGGEQTSGLLARLTRPITRNF